MYAGTKFIHDRIRGGAGDSSNVCEKLSKGEIESYGRNDFVIGGQVEHHAGGADLRPAPGMGAGGNRAQGIQGDSGLAVGAARNCSAASS